MMEAPKKKTHEIQQQFANSIGYRGSSVWDRFAADDKEVLLTKLEILFPTIELSEEENITLTEKEITSIKKDNDKILTKRNHLLEQIWAQRIFCGGNLKMSILFTLNTPVIGDDLSMAKESTTYTLHPVFRIWKCSVKGDSKDCCKIFIDETGRVYENWIDFIQYNGYSKGILIAPKDGVYDIDDQNKVILECHLTPNATTLNKTLRVVDTSASIAGIVGSAVPAGIALFTPLALPVAIGALAIGGITSIYAVGRSISNLVDRGQHQESINITDRQARMDWFSIFGGVFSIGASGATIGVASHIARGKVVTEIAEKAVKGVNAAAIAVNGVGVGNGVAEVIIKINENEKFTSLEILQFSTSLLLFTHSIYNYQLASRILQKSKGSPVEIQNILNEEQRQYFTEMVNETMRFKKIQSSSCNGIDIIRCLGKIPDIASGLIRVDLSPIDILRIAGMVKQITENYFISDKSNLENCFNILIQTLNSEAIDFILTIVESFLHDILNAIETDVRPLIPYDHLLWDIFQITNRLNGFKKLITKDFLVSNMLEIRDEFANHFSEYLNRNTEEIMIKCKKCSGSYQIYKL